MLEKENESIKQFIGGRDKSVYDLNKKISQLNKFLNDKDDIIDNLRSQIV